MYSSFELYGLQFDVTEKIRSLKSQHCFWSYNKKMTYMLRCCFCGRQLWGSDGEDFGWWCHVRDSQEVTQLAKGTILSINISTESLKWCLILRPMWANRLCQILHVHVASDTKKIQSSELPKWHCMLRRNVNSRLLSDITSFQMVWQTDCRYQPPRKTSDLGHIR